MAQQKNNKTIISDDWTKNWQASIAVKITAVVMWAIIPFGFIIALLLVNNIEDDINTAIGNDAEILVNSTRVLLWENNAYNSHQLIAALDKNLKKSIYCKITLATAGSRPIILYANGCQQQASIIDKTYFFTTMVNDQPQELTLTLSHQSVKKIIIKQRSNVIVVMIIMVIILGLLLTGVIRWLVLKPLLKMVDATKLISEGKHELRLNLNQDDEFGHLATFLNKMLDQIFEQQTNLKHANLDLMKEVAKRNRISLELRTSRDQLEKLVDERTADLAAARDEALDANNARSLFLANMSHEIRTPLNSILSYSQLLNRDSGFTDKQLKIVRIIEESGKHLLALLNDILDLSKIEAGKMVLNTMDFELNELLQEVAHTFQQRCSEKTLNWHANVALKESLVVHSDPQKIRQILTNLLANAIKFTDRGDISLNVIHLENDIYSFEVSDTGSGIAPENVDNFFHQEKTSLLKGGTGLGLAITKKQLQLLNSELRISSTIDEGSLFSFTLELKTVHSDFELRPERGLEVVRLAMAGSIKTFVVDDVELSRNLLVNMLEKIDAKVDTAVNGLKAIDFLSALPSDEIPDIIFMATHMPVMDGIEAVKILKEKYGQKIICVAVTASAMEHLDNNDYGSGSGFDDCISKPYRFEAVFDCMKKHLDIDFEYKNTAQTVHQAIEKINFEQCNIEPDLCEKLLDASKCYALTQLKKLLSKLEAHGEQEKILARKLSQLMEQYNMQAMVELLEKLQSKSSDI